VNCRSRSWTSTEAHRQVVLQVAEPQTDGPKPRQAKANQASAATLGGLLEN